MELMRDRLAVTVELPESETALEMERGVPGVQSQKTIKVKGGGEPLPGLLTIAGLFCMPGKGPHPLLALPFLRIRVHERAEPQGIAIRDGHKTSIRADNKAIAQRRGRWIALGIDFEPSQDVPCTHRPLPIGGRCGGPRNDSVTATTNSNAED